MTHMKRVCLVAFCMLSAACVSRQDGAVGVNEPEVHTVAPYKQKVIALENLKTRTVVYCYASEVFSAEECAADVEKYGYVKLTDIPKFTAERDFLTTGTYPTRRWRETDQAPRW